jgi:adenylate cyclase
MISKAFTQYSKLLIEFISFWVVAMSSFTTFRYLGMDQSTMVVSEVEKGGNSVFFEPLVPMLILGVSLGILYSFIDFFFRTYLEKNMALGTSIVLRAFIYIVATITIVTITIKISSIFIEHNFNLEIGWWIYDKRFWAVGIYIFVAGIFHNFVRIASERFGKGVFVNMLFGKYRVPREEKRIFMFLDLKDSVKIAHQLGYFLHSQFLQDCFHDLNQIVPKYEAQIYQYVGDEAVLSWSFKKGILNHNCVAVFFAFQKKLISRQAYYLDKYDVFPEFKAGLHGGTLMAAEVGFVKKELAYHGDVINTSARLQAECNKQGESFITSNELLCQIKNEGSIIAKSLGNVFLKGKDKSIGIHAVIGLFR